MNDDRHQTSDIEHQTLITDVAIGVLTEQQHGYWKLLISQRPEHTVYGGYWEFPGGKVRSGETLRQCLTREFEEELGLCIHPLKLLEVIGHEYAHGRVRLHVFLCRLWKEEGRENQEARNLEVSQHKWVEPWELREYRFPPANDDLVRRLMAPGAVEEIISEIHGAGLED